MFSGLQDFYRTMVLFTPFTGHYLPISTSLVLGGAFFILGIALVMVASIIFVVIVFKTITYTPKGWEKQPSGALLASALGVSGLVNLFRKKENKNPLQSPYLFRNSQRIG